MATTAPRRSASFPAALAVTAVAAAALVTPAVATPATPTAAPHAAPTAAPTAAALTVPASTWDGSKWGDPKADKVAKDPKGHNAATLDPGSLYTVENAIGARKVWQQKDAAKRQITGTGVTVALLDSGTAAVSGLTADGKLSYGPDLSIEGNGMLLDKDTYGHGTHLAGIIAAHDPATLTASSIPKLSPSVQLGVAPGAHLLSMKLATRDGSTDVSQVIAALNWVTEHQTAADGSRVRVVNLSFGTESVQPYQLDPLAAAAENAWKHGLVVVVSAGNDGTAAHRLTDPAMDPYVIAVGASSSQETVLGWKTAAVAPFSNSGTTARHADLLAPGTSIVSLRDPGSEVDTAHPEGRVAGDTTGRLFRGSGTSQAAAVLSGAVALLLQAFPALTPDQVKALLVASATKVAAAPVYAGAGQLNIDAAYELAKHTGAGSAFRLPGNLGTLVAQRWPASTGQGSLDKARGGDALVDPSGSPIDGEVDVQGYPWTPRTWWAAASAARTWQGGSWLGHVWTGAGWAPASGTSPRQWTAHRWSASRWSSASWDAAGWSASRWSAHRWSAARWSDASWG